MKIDVCQAMVPVRICALERRVRFPAKDAKLGLWFTSWYDSGMPSNHALIINRIERKFRGLPLRHLGAFRPPSQLLEIALQPEEIGLRRARRDRHRERGGFGQSVAVHKGAADEIPRLDQRPLQMGAAHRILRGRLHPVDMAHDGEHLDQPVVSARRDAVEVGVARQKIATLIPRQKLPLEPSDGAKI